MLKGRRKEKMNKKGIGDIVWVIILMLLAILMSYFIYRILFVRILG